MRIAHWAVGVRGEPLISQWRFLANGRTSGNFPTHRTVHGIKGAAGSPQGAPERQ